MRFLRTAAFALLSLSGLHASGQALTPITATQVYGGPTPITGTLCFTPVDKYGNNIAVSKSGGGYYAPGRPFCGTLTAGALTASLSVPNSATDSPAGHSYAMSITDTVNHITYAPVIISGISGTTWSLDTYAPSVSVSTTAAFTYTTGAGAPTGVCTAPALYGQTNGALWQCVAGAWVADTPFPYLSNVTGAAQATCAPDPTTENSTSCAAMGVSSTEFSGAFQIQIGNDVGDTTYLVARITLPAHGSLGDICSAALVDVTNSVYSVPIADGIASPGTVSVYFSQGVSLGALNGGDIARLTYSCVRAVAP